MSKCIACVFMILTMALVGASGSVSTGDSQVSFTEVTEQAGVVFEHHERTAMETGGGAAFLDYHGDDYLHLYVVGGGGPNMLFRNNGNGTFVDVTDSAGVADTGRIYRGVAYAD